MYEIKPAKTIEEQIDILESRGVFIEDRKKVEDVLLSINYYTFSGYLFEFKNEHGTYNNVSFNKVYNIYLCDKRLKSIILYAIEDIEHNIKTKMAYSMAHSNGPLGYTKAENFVDAEEHNFLIWSLNRNINRNKKLPGRNRSWRN